MGALQFARRYPGVLRVSFDRGRMVHEDSVPAPRPPPPPSAKGNLIPYAPQKPDPPRRSVEGDGNDVIDRSMVRREGPDCRETTSFYRGGRAPHRSDGAAAGGEEAVPHKIVSSVMRPT